jgi:hypothetical protein
VQDVDSNSPSRSQEKSKKLTIDNLIMDEYQPEILVTDIAQDTTPNKDIKEDDTVDE